MNVRNTANLQLSVSLFTVNFVYYGAGTVTFGAVDSTQYTGSVSYTPVLSGTSFWDVNMTSYSVGTGALKTFSQIAILDTGTTLTYLPNSVCKKYWAQVTGSVVESDGNYYFPCNATLPDLHLVVQGGAVLTIHGRYINPYGLGYMDPTLICLGGLQASDDIGFNILGLALYQSMFVVFDLGGSRAGFAAKALLD
jgi:aspergillopepsin I